MSAELIGARVAQIYQPARDELIFSFRAAEGTKKVLIRLTDSPRVHISSVSVENPPVPPMLCMLLRKRLGGARLTDITQPGNERVLCLCFEAVNEIGDRDCLYIEIMGRYSNAVLTDGKNRIIETVRRIDFSQSGGACALPKLGPMSCPPVQDKLCIERHSADEICERIEALGGDDRAVLTAIQGISPIIARELCIGHPENDIKTQTEYLEELVEEQGRAYLWYIRRTARRWTFASWIYVSMRARSR